MYLHEKYKYVIGYLYYTVILEKYQQLFEKLDKKLHKKDTAVQPNSSQKNIDC